MCWQILGKAEMLNPGGSVKDRVALQIVKEALSSGRLTKGGLITEGTVGDPSIANPEAFRFLVLCLFLPLVYRSKVLMKGFTPGCFSNDWTTASYMFRHTNLCPRVSEQADRTGRSCLSKRRMQYGV